MPHPDDCDGAPTVCPECNHFAAPADEGPPFECPTCDAFVPEIAD